MSEENDDKAKNWGQPVQAGGEWKQPGQAPNIHDPNASTPAWPEPQAQQPASWGQPAGAPQHQGWQQQPGHTPQGAPPPAQGQPGWGQQNAQQGQPGWGQQNAQQGWQPQPGPQHAQGQPGQAPWQQQQPHGAPGQNPNWNPQNYPVQANKTWVQPKNNSPGLMAVASFFIPGLGQLLLGQTVKGIALFFGAWFGPCIVNILAAVDAQKIGEKMNKGQAVEEWEFF